MLNHSSLIDGKFANQFSGMQEGISRSDHRNETGVSRENDDLEAMSGLNRLEIDNNLELYGEVEEPQNPINLWAAYNEVNKSKQVNEQKEDIEINDEDNDRICDDLFGEDSNDDDFNLPLDEDVLNKI